MKNLSNFLEKYPNVYPVLNNKFAKINHGMAEDMTQDYIIYISKKVDWNLEDKEVLSYIYGGVQYFALNFINRTIPDYTDIFPEGTLQVVIDKNYDIDDVGIVATGVEDLKASNVIIDHSFVQDLEMFVNNVPDIFKEIGYAYIKALKSGAGVNEYGDTIYKDLNIDYKTASMRKSRFDVHLREFLKNYSENCSITC